MAEPDTIIYEDSEINMGELVAYMREVSRMMNERQQKEEKGKPNMVYDAKNEEHGYLG